MSVLELTKGIAKKLGLRVSRERPSNRFQATDECLFRMKSFGYEPKVIVDVGANRGQFYRIVRPIHPNASYHLIEPQPGCAEALREIARSERVEYHAFALTEPGHESVRLLGMGPIGGSTGAYVGKPGERSDDEIVVPATTLDGLLSERIGNAHRALLKLDVESHELSVLRGAIASLERIETVLIEVSFFDVGNRGNPSFFHMLAFFEERGFTFYDVASLSGRPRDMRLRMGDLLFVRRGSPLLEDTAWE